MTTLQPDSTPTATDPSQTRPCIGFVTESFLGDDGRLYEGGAERHLLHVVELARRCGADVRVYQRSSSSATSDYMGIPVVRRPVSIARLGTTLGRLAIADGCTHVHFAYLERVPKGLPVEAVSATCPAVYWDLPYLSEYHPWYPGGRAARLALPAWRRLQKLRCLRGVERCTAVLCTDSSLLRVVQSDRPELRDRIMVVPNYSDLAPTGLGGVRAEDLNGPLRSMALARQAGTVTVLIPRNLSLVRGGPWLTDIVALTVERYGADCKFFFTGSAVSVYGRGRGYQRLLQGALARLSDKARDCIEFLDGLQRDLMARAFELADIVLVPTLAHEGGSLAALEAMRLGRALICTNVGGLSDLVRDGYTGLLVTPTAEAIARGVARLAGAPGLRAQLAAEAQREAAARFTVEAWDERAAHFASRSGWSSVGGTPW